MLRSPVKLFAQDACVTLPSFRVTRTWRPGGFALPLHTHDHTNIALCTSGSYGESLDRRWLRVTRASVICRPGGVPHANNYGNGPSRAVIFEVPAPTLATIAALSRALDQPLHLESAAIAGLARRVDEQLTVADGAARLALEGLAYELIAYVAQGECAAPPPGPRWMRRVEEFLQAEFRRTLSMDEIARVAGVHPSHLARSFRVRFGKTIGDYVRELRLARAVDRLRDPRASLVEISAECGFYDQSHFTRAFTRRMGISPARYRKLRHRR